VIFVCVDAINVIDIFKLSGVVSTTLMNLRTPFLCVELDRTVKELMFLIAFSSRLRFLFDNLVDKGETIKELEEAETVLLVTS
jgi:hypothetical protein